MRKMIGLCSALMFMALTQPAAAQSGGILYQPDPDSPIGERNPKAPPETAQYDFVIGDWDVAITYTPPGGKPFDYKAKWHNHWIVDGYVVMQEWRGPYSSGAEMRFFDAARKQWTGQNIYTGAQWDAASAEWDGSTMQVFVPKTGPEGEFINRETYYDIALDSFKMKADVSYDGGKTWSPGKYHMMVTRAE